MLKRTCYIHKDEAEVLKKLNVALLSESNKNELIDLYERFEEDSLLPDLIGKTVEINENQFPRIYNIVKRIANLLEMKVPSIYVYESFYYDVNAEGLKHPWIKISTKSITDLSEKELEFLLARQMCHIKEGHIEYEILCEQYSKMIMVAASFGAQASTIIPTGPLLVNEFADIKSAQFKLIASQWSRISEYSADFCAYIICNDLAASIAAIKKTILNSVELANEMKLKAYIEQGNEIMKFKSVVSQYSIFDEQIPYGPFRIKELIGFASNLNTKKEVRDLHKQ